MSLFANLERSTTLSGSMRPNISKEWLPFSYAPFLLPVLADSNWLKTSFLGTRSISLRCGIAVDLNPGPKYLLSVETSARNQDSIHCTIRCACSSRVLAGRCQPSRDLKCRHGELFSKTGASLSTSKSGISPEFLPRFNAIRKRFSVSSLLPHATTFGICPIRPAFLKKLENPERQAPRNFPCPPPSTYTFTLTTGCPPIHRYATDHPRSIP